MRCYRSGGCKKVYRHLDASGLTCKYILLTHGHFDHILGVKEMQDAGARVFIGEKDADMLYDNNKTYPYLQEPALSHARPTRN